MPPGNLRHILVAKFKTESLIAVEIPKRRREIKVGTYDKSLHHSMYDTNKQKTTERRKENLCETAGMIHQFRQNSRRTTRF